MTGNVENVEDLIEQIRESTDEGVISNLVKRVEEILFNDRDDDEYIKHMMEVIEICGLKYVWDLEGLDFWLRKPYILADIVNKLGYEKCRDDLLEIAKEEVEHNDGEYIGSGPIIGLEYLTDSRYREDKEFVMAYCENSITNIDYASKEFTESPQFAVEFWTRFAEPIKNLHENYHDNSGWDNGYTTENIVKAFEVALEKEYKENPSEFKSVFLDTEPHLVGLCNFISLDFVFDYCVERNDTKALELLNPDRYESNEKFIKKCKEEWGEDVFAFLYLDTTNLSMSDFAETNPTESSVHYAGRYVESKEQDRTTVEGQEQK